MSESPNCSIDELQKYIQFPIRITVLIVAFLSSGFIGLTCLRSYRRKYWLFKLLITQSCAEIIDLFFAIIISNESQCFPKLCKFVGYIMHTSWLTSFTCILIIYYLYYAAVTLNPLYDKLVKNINQFIIISIVWPYLWLLIPLLQNQIGATGWYLYGKEEIFFIYCGFKDGQGQVTFFIFWTISMFTIFLFVFVLYCKIQDKLKGLVSGTGEDLEELHVIKSAAQFSIIYIVSWSINQFLKYIQLFDFNYQNNIFIYLFYVTFYLLFELHLTFIAYKFYQCFNPVIKINEIWFNTKSKKQKKISDSFQQLLN